MKWRMEFPRSLLRGSKRKPHAEESTSVDPGPQPEKRKNVALELKIRGDIIDMTAHPDSGEAFPIEELTTGLNPCRVLLEFETLSPSSPIVWVAAVTEDDAKAKVEFREALGVRRKTAEVTIAGGTIVPVRALFDAAGIEMTSGCSLDFRLQGGSGSIRVYRQARRFRHLVH